MNEGGSYVSINVVSLVPLVISKIEFSDGKSVSEWLDILSKMEDKLKPNVSSDVMYELCKKVRKEE